MRIACVLGRHLNNAGHSRQIENRLLAFGCLIHVSNAHVDNVFYVIILFVQNCDKYNCCFSFFVQFINNNRG